MEVGGAGSVTKWGERSTGVFKVLVRVFIGVSDLFIRNALRELRAYYQLYSWVSV